MKIFEMIAEMGHEQVVFCSDLSSGYRGIIVIHSTALGPSVGGTRFWNYSSEEEAIIDALRLARGMTYKNAVAGLPFGGGKSVILGDNKTTEREKIFRAHGRFIETLGGRYLAGEDVGTSTTDIGYVSLETRHVGGLEGKSGDPSIMTAHGVFYAMRAAAHHRWGSDDLSGRIVAIQGCGHVGYNLAKELHTAGARLIVSDINAEQVTRAVTEFGAERVEPESIYGVEADIFAPCALGGIINDETIPQFKIEIIAGAANNQLLEERHGLLLEERSILYAPDYVANAGGVINGVCIELLGWEAERTHEKVRRIHDTMLEVFELARKTGGPTSEAAGRLAELRLKEGPEGKEQKASL